MTLEELLKNITTNNFTLSCNLVEKLDEKDFSSFIDLIKKNDVVIKRVNCVGGSDTPQQLTLMTTLIHYANFESLTTIGCGALISTTIFGLIRDLLILNKVSLRSLTIANNQVDDEIVKVLVEGLKNNNTLKELSLYNNKIGDDSLIALSAILEYEHTVIEVLNVGRNNITGAGVQALVKALKTNRSIKKLDLQHNMMNIEAVFALFAMLEQDCVLEELVLEDATVSTIWHSKFACLINSLKKNKSLKAINLSNVNGGGYSRESALVASAYEDLFEKNTTLEKIKLSGDFVSAEEVVALCKGLKFNTTLKHLNLSANSVAGQKKTEGIKAIAQLLQNNSSLRSLNLERNWITEENAIIIAEAIKHNKSLNTLKLNGNGISQVGIQALADALKNNKSITTLEYDPYPLNTDIVITRELQKEITDYLTRNKLLVSLKDINDALFHNIMNPDFDVAAIYKQIQESLNLINATGMYSDHPVRPYHNSLLATIVRFHLRCIDTSEDNTPINNIHPAVLRAEEAFTFIDPDTDAYRQACFHLGRYYFQRGSLLNFDGGSFLKTALYYFNQCQMDDSFCEDECCENEPSSLPMFINEICRHLINENPIVRSNYVAGLDAIDKKQIAYTLALEYSNARNLPENKKRSSDTDKMIMTAAQLTVDDALPIAEKYKQIASEPSGWRRRNACRG